MKKRIACWALAGLAMVPQAWADVASDAAFSDPGQIQTEAYIRLAQADQSFDAERFDEARAGYSDALALYDGIARDWPDFSPASIAYRIAYCRNQLEALHDKMAPVQTAQAPAAQPAASEGDAAPAGKGSNTRRKTREEQEHAREVEFLREQLQSLRDELAKSDDAQDALSAEIENLRADNMRLKAQLDSRGEITISELKQLRSDFEFAKTHVVALQRELDAANGLRDALDETEGREAASRERIAELEAALAAKDDAMDDLELELADREGRIRGLEGRVQQLESQLAGVPGDFAAAPAAEPAPVAVPEIPAAPEPPAAKAPAAAPAPAPAPAAPNWNLPPLYQPRGAARDIPAGVEATAFVRELLDGGENDAALLTVRRALEASPGDLNLSLLEGVALIRVGAYDEAVDLLLPLAKANPKHAELHANLGAAMMGAGDYDEARATLERAVKLDKRQGEAHFNLALLYANTHPMDLKQAAKHYKQALDLGMEPDPDLEAVLP